MKEKFLKEENLLLKENGEIYRLNKKNKKWEKPPIFILKNRNNQYPTLSVTINGKQELFYAHRLIAEAFVDNPNNYNLVEIIDRNPFNISAKNLRWISKRRAVEKAKETRDKNSITCKKCGRKYHKNLKECPVCRKEKERQKEKIQKAKLEFQDVLMDELRPKHKKALKMRLEGKTLQEIADEFEVSRERVRQILVETKTNTGRITWKQQEDFNYLIKNLENKINELEEEIQSFKKIKKQLEKGKDEGV